MEENSTALKRRNSVPSSVEIPINDSKPLLRTSTNAPNGHHHATPSLSFSAVVDFELIPLKSPSYISLRDILPSSPSVLSPTATAFVATTTTTSASSTYSSSGGISFLSGCEISIRNRLVKQAAWAYLQPMSSSPSASGGRFWRCFSGESLKPFLESVKLWIVDTVTRVCNCL
ncbi:hypothetical protein Ancab_031521 [Ancistrocladus abbreviatus]